MWDPDPDLREKQEKGQRRKRAGGEQPQQEREPPGVRGSSPGLILRANAKMAPEGAIKQSNPASAGVPGLEPRLTGPEPVGLPITPYPNVAAGAVHGGESSGDRPGWRTERGVAGRCWPGV